MEGGDTGEDSESRGQLQNGRLEWVSKFMKEIFTRRNNRVLSATKQSTPPLERSVLLGKGLFGVEVGRECIERVIRGGRGAAYPKDK